MVLFPDSAVGLAQVTGLIPKGTRVAIFRRIYWVFLVLGTLVGVVVIGYMMYNAYKYRDHEDRDALDDPPQLGEIPGSGGKGRKLFLSFSLSAIIVVSLIVWTYGTLLAVESETIPANTAITEQEYTPGEELTVFIEGYRFAWRYTYPNGATFTSAAGEPLRVPVDTQVHLIVTSTDVMHNIWIPALRAKADAIPGMNTTTWFTASETGTYIAQCAELCGAGHSYMDAKVVVMKQEAFTRWYRNQSTGNTTTLRDNSATKGVA